MLVTFCIFFSLCNRDFWTQPQGAIQKIPIHVYYNIQFLNSAPGVVFGNLWYHWFTCLACPSIGHLWLHSSGHKGGLIIYGQKGRGGANVFKPTLWRTRSTSSIFIGCSNNNTAANSRLSTCGFKHFFFFGGGWGGGGGIFFLHTKVTLHVL